jgi:hypothetical protein
MMKEAAPAPAWTSICCAYALRCFADRCLKFFLPLYLSFRCHSVKPTAALTLAQNSSVLLLVTIAGKAYERRSNGFVLATIIENLAVVVGSSFLWWYTKTDTIDDSPLQSTLFIMAMMLGCVDAICSSLLTTVIGKDWTAKLFPSSPSELSQANARLSQIDLLCATIAPLYVSEAIHIVGYSRAFYLLVGQHIVGGIMIIGLVQHAFKLEPKLRQVSQSVTPKESETLQDIESWINPFKTIYGNPQVSAGVKCVTTAYLCLYCTVLSPGGLLNAWLQQSQLATEDAIAWTGSLSNLLGACATVISPLWIRSCGFDFYLAGFLAQASQTVCIWSAGLTVYQLTSTAFKVDIAATQQTILMWFLIPVAVSRIGLWTFDLVERQLIQESSGAGMMGYFTAEGALTQLCSLWMTFLGYHYGDESFHFLIYLSVGNVSLAFLLLLIVWALPLLRVRGKRADGHQGKIPKDD